MKKKLVILLIISALFLVGCGANENSSSNDSEKTNSKNEELSVDLSKLTKSGWEKTEKGYELQGKKDGCKYYYTVSIADNTMHLQLNFDYDSGNENIIGMYEQDDIIAPGLSSTWFEDIKTITGCKVGKLAYKVVVGKTTVGKGTLTDEEAEEIASKYNE